MKTQIIERRLLLRGQFKGELADRLPIRPPWAIEESQFTERCSRCYKCAEACPSRLIVKGSGGFPEVSFLRHGCDYCEACVRVCPENALSMTDENQPTAWLQVARISSACFTSRGIVCRSCGEVCETAAIKFKLTVGGSSQISLDTAACTGCGECVHVCPADAIKIVKSQLETIHE